MRDLQTIHEQETARHRRYRKAVLARRGPRPFPQGRRGFGKRTAQRPVSSEEYEAEVAFIVKAVHNHERLVEALETMRVAFDHGSDPAATLEVRNQAIQLTRAALKAIK